MDAQLELRSVGGPLMRSLPRYARVQVANNLIPVLFNGLGSHITMIPQKNLTVYLKVCGSSLVCMVIHLLILSDWMVQSLGLHHLHRLY